VEALYDAVYVCLRDSGRPIQLLAEENVHVPIIAEEFNAQALWVALGAAVLKPLEFACTDGKNSGLRALG